MVSGSWACTSMGNPKSDGRFPEISRQDSPPLSLRITSQCFCMNSTPGRVGCIARRCTQCPTSASGSGMPSDWSPRLIGRQVWPASSERNAPAAEIAANIRPVPTGPAGSCAGTSRPRPAARTGRTHGRGASAAPASSARRHQSGTAPRPQPRHTQHLGHPATAPGARLARTPTGVVSRRTTDASRASRRRRTGCPPAPTLRRRHQSAGSPALTSRWTVTHTAARDRQVILSRDRSPSHRSAGR